MNNYLTSKKNTFSNLSKFHLRELNKFELKNTNGGAPIAGAAAVAVAVGGGIAIFVGAAFLAYGTYKLVEWALE